MKKKIVNNIILFLPIFILISISLINMYNISFIKGYENYLFKQTLWFTIGFIVLFIIVLFKPQFFFKNAKIIYILNIILLILVLFWGTSVNGSKAWFKFSFFSIQPSEIMKFSLALYLSQIISKEKSNNMRQELKVFLKALFITIIPSLLVFLEPDTGAIVIYFLIMLGVVLIYKINYKWYILMGIVLVLFLGIFLYLYYFNRDLLINIIGTSFFYRIDRLLTFVNNDSFQLDRALISIGTSSLFRGNSGVYIPEAPTDFIIAYSISKLGIISFIIILICFLVLNGYFLTKIYKIKNKQYKMFISSFLIMFIFAQIQNIGMNLGLLPIIGLPLPFISYGGTNIIVYFMFLGILISLKN